MPSGSLNTEYDHRSGQVLNNEWIGLQHHAQRSVMRLIRPGDQPLCRHFI